MIKNLAWLEISRPALEHNIGLFRKTVGRNALIAPAVKANAYGHGLIDAAKTFISAGADWLCVNSAAEAQILRQAGIKIPILLIGRFAGADIELILKLKIKAFIDDYELAKKLSAAAARKKQRIAIHLKIDTGMNRQGVAANGAIKFARKISVLPYLSIEGLATHFAASDERKKSLFSNKQLDAFNGVAGKIEKLLGKKLIKHCSNTAAAMIYPDSRLDLIRPGIGSYGLYPSLEVQKIWEKKNQSLKPALTFKTKIALIKNISKNDCVSYGCAFIADKSMSIALLPIGYYDGLDRKLSNQGEILIHGRRAKILGRVCMDLTVVDISKIKKARIGDEAVIIGRQGKNIITADELAQKIGTINYEVVTRLRESLPRYYVK